MVVSMVIYDQISPLGVFSKVGSALDAKVCITQISKTSLATKGNLLDSLQFSTRTFDKASDSIKRLIVNR